MRNLLFILMSVVIFSCNKLPSNGNGNNDGAKIKGKVIRITCASTTIQILDSAFYNLGETWTMNGTSNTYEHIATVANKCEFPDALHEGDIFNFKIINEADANNNCAVCAMYDYPPSKSVFLKVIN